MAWIKRYAGFLATVLGGLLLVAVLCLAVLSFFYRPTLEYAFVAGREVTLEGAGPLWFVSIAFGGIGCGLLWAGRALRHR